MRLLTSRLSVRAFLGPGIRKKRERERERVCVCVGAHGCWANLGAKPFDFQGHTLGSASRSARARWAMGDPEENRSTMVFGDTSNCSSSEMTAVGFEPTPFRNGALSHRLRPLGQTVMSIASCWATTHIRKSIALFSRFTVADKMFFDLSPLERIFWKSGRPLNFGNLKK